MINRLIEFSLRVRGLVVAVMIGVIAFGIYSYRQMAVDAFPDISPVMVPVFAEAHEHAGRDLGAERHPCGHRRAQEPLERAECG